MSQPQFRAHTLMAAALINFCLALVNIVHCAVSINWKAILIGVYRGGIKTRLALKTAKTKTITTIEQSKEYVAITLKETKPAIAQNFEYITKVANPNRTFTAIRDYTRTFASDVVAAANES